MSSFLVSARKYRPLAFSDVVGQEVITKTLESAVNNNSLPQSLLFSGPKGVGKTTCARILAKEINSKFSEIQKDDDFSYNIFEMDAASNNSVEDIRALIEQVKFAPQRGKYKIYIIDEAHMLSQSAFNAFLKTLEEPPEYVIFILATTEKQKIIPTILSRCQIFDFKKIGIIDIQKHIIKISKQENISISEESANLIARKSDGSLRDALGIFDRIISFCGNDIEKEQVLDSLNMLDNDYYFAVCDHIISNDIQELIIILDKIIKKGYDIHHFIVGLGQHFRDLFFCKSPKTLSLLELDSSTLDRYSNQSNKFDNDLLFKYLKCINDCELNYKNSKNQRLLLEITLMNLVNLNKGLDVSKDDEPIYENKITENNAIYKKQKDENEDIKKIESKKHILSDKEEKPAKKEIKDDKILPVVSPRSNDYKRDKELVDDKKTHTQTSEYTKTKSSNTKTNIPIFTETINIEKKESKLDLNQDILNNIKESYLKDLKSKRSNIFFNLFKDLEFKIIKDLEIELVFSSAAKNFKKQRDNFVLYLKDKLSNDNIWIKQSYIYNEVVEEDLSNIPFTEREVYEHMLESNPYLKEFKDKLKLDSDF